MSQTRTPIQIVQDCQNENSTPRSAAELVAANSAALGAFMEAAGVTSCTQVHIPQPYPNALHFVFCKNNTQNQLRSFAKHKDAEKICVGRPPLLELVSLVALEDNLHVPNFFLFFTHAPRHAVHRFLCACVKRGAGDRG